VTAPGMNAIARALSLAAGALGRTSPNPAVGAVVVDHAGTIVGHGATRPYGDAHAEPLALAMAGDRAVGATLYVTLEPCSHHGKTPPCANVVIAAGVARVIIATLDPNPRVSGRGVARLRAAGIAVEVGPGADEARSLMAGFATWISTRRPHVIAKFAVSLDGRIATRTGDSRWISGPEARRWAHGVRDWVDAILVGVGTVRADDPALTYRPTTLEVPVGPDPVPSSRPDGRGGTSRLTSGTKGEVGSLSAPPTAYLREGRGQSAPSTGGDSFAVGGGDPLLAGVVAVGSGHAPRQPLRVVMDSQLRTPVKSQVASGFLPSTTLIVGVDDGSAAWAARRTTLQRPGVEVVSVAAGQNGRPDPASVLELLGARGITTLLVEGGGTIHEAFFRAGLVDRVAAVLAPVVIGGGPSAVGSPSSGPERLADASRLSGRTVSVLGEDVLVTGWLRSPRWVD
jgi:riboflavin biosynthesis pyrimidine reductase/pyrimidine deaminase RibD-like protein